MRVDFESRESHLLLNPRLPQHDRERFERLAPSIEGHIFVATSGTTGAARLVALSKEAVLASAAAVNRRLGVTGASVWIGVLPVFHVGGLGVRARAHLSGARLYELPWDAAGFHAKAREVGATHVSLVPAQVRDLLTGGFQPAPSLRVVLVGGGVFGEELCAEARRAGWPVLPSYGMSECSSTVAIEGELLDHLDARRESDGRLAFRGSSLLTAYADEAGLVDPKRDGWFVSEDLGEVDGRTVKVFGRGSDFVKIGGESVDLKRLDAILETIAGSDAAVVVIEDERLGGVIHLAVTRDPNEIQAAYNANVLPFERARGVHVIDAIPRSPLGKLLRARLAERIGR